MESREEPSHSTCGPLASPLPRAGSGRGRWRRSRWGWGWGWWGGGGCVSNPPGVRGVAGTAPAPNVFWTPPPLPRPTPAETTRATPALPPDLASRIQALKLADVVDIALRNNTATAAAWADARAAAATYGAARGQYYPTVELDVNATAVKTAATAGRISVQQRLYGPTFNASWLLFDFGARSGSVAGAREALLAADWTHNAVIQNVVLDAATAYFQYHATKALLGALIARAVRERPDLLAARATAQGAQARVTAARGQALPSLVVSGTTAGTYFFNRPLATQQGNSYSATIGLRIPLFSGWSQIYDVRAATAAARAAEQRRKGVEQQVIFQVFNSFYGLRTATQRVRTSADLLASATQSEQVALGRYKAGAGSLLDLLSAQVALADARAQGIEARLSWYVALAGLAHDAGILGLDGTSPLHLQTDSTGTGW